MQFLQSHIVQALYMYTDIVNFDPIKLTHDHIFFSIQLHFVADEISSNKVKSLQTYSQQFKLTILYFYILKQI